MKFALHVIMFCGVLSQFSAGKEPFCLSLMTDMHMNPLYSADIGEEYGCYPSLDPEPTPTTNELAPYGRFTCDPGAALVESAFLTLAQQIPQFVNSQQQHVVIIPGDIMGHNVVIKDFSSKLAKSPLSKRNDDKTELFWNTLNMILDIVKSSIGDHVVLFAFGNNDMLYHNQVPLAKHKEEFYSRFYKAFFQSIPGNFALTSKDNEKTFLDGGYYYYEHSNDLRFLVLNTMYFYSKNDKKNDPDAAHNQLDWLKDQLAMAQDKNQDVILVQHVPYGKLGGDKSYYQKKYADKYLKIMYEYRNTIINSIGAHVHVGQQRVDSFFAHDYSANKDIPFSNFLTRNVFNKITGDNLNKNNGNLDLQYELFNNLILYRAITPRNLNNPGFSFTSYEVDYATNKYYPHSFKEFTFDLQDSLNSNRDPSEFWHYLFDTYSDLGIQSLTKEGFEQFHAQMFFNTDLFFRYLCYMSGYEDHPENYYRAYTVFKERDYFEQNEEALLQFYLQIKQIKKD